MFSYYGSKSKLIHLYPEPVESKIIEPFAGSARYSLKYFDRDIVIYELFHKVYEIWKFLQSASIKDILSLPNVGYKEKIPSHLSDPERWLIGYCIGRGSPRPMTMGHKYNSWEKDKHRIAQDLYKIRHWQIFKADGMSHPNERATYFVDAPYQIKGHKYNHRNINYELLSKWCKSREGQVIVCENVSATWLDFEHLSTFRGGQMINTEVIWHNLDKSEKLCYN